MKDEINKMDTKSVKTKISIFTLQIYAFVYSVIMDFPRSNFEFDVLATCNLFSNIIKLHRVKIHLNHSNVIDKIRDYVDDFCNLKLTIDQNEKETIKTMLEKFVLPHNYFSEI